MRCLLSPFVCVAMAVQFTLMAQGKLCSQETEAYKTKTAEVIALAKKSIAEITGASIEGGAETKLVAKGPVYTFVDPVRQIASGTLWVWAEDEGRPAAIMSLATVDERRFCEVHSFSEKKLRFDIHGKAWTPASAWQPTDIPDAPAHAESEQRRLFQMRRLLERFRGTEDLPGKPATEMRILPTPIYRYANSAMVKDGAVFAIVRDGGPIGCQARTVYRTATELRKAITRFASKQSTANHLPTFPLEMV